MIVCYRPVPLQSGRDKAKVARDGVTLETSGISGVSVVHER
jgi:hypothetical protein